MAKVENLERRYGITLPDDFRAYLVNACPGGFFCDEEVTEWWTADRIKNIPDECGHRADYSKTFPRTDQYLFFADCCVWCWAWAIACTDDENRGRVIVVGGPERFVAGSFSEFVNLYVSSTNSLL